MTSFSRIVHWEVHILPRVTARDTLFYVTTAVEQIYYLKSLSLKVFSVPTSLDAY